MPTFEPFGTQHWLATGITVGAGVLLPLLVRRFAVPNLEETARKVIVLCVAAYIGIGLVLKTGVYGLPLQQILPLHLCDASVVLGALTLWLRSYRLYEVVYFWGTGGVLAALLTPDLHVVFPHPLFIIFFVGHGLAFLSVMFATLVWGFRPRAVSILIALAATAAYSLLIFPVNLLLGSNYLYLMRKPAQPSPLDYLGPWPWYILGLGAVTACVCALCYLPHVRFAAHEAAEHRGKHRIDG